MDVCTLHENQMETVSRIETKVDDIVRRQLTFVSDLAYLKNSLDNGIRRDIKEANEEVLCLSKKMSEYIASTAATIQEVKDFKWFREMINSFRNNLFSNMLKLILAFLLVLTMMHTSDQIMKIVVKALGG
jgi:hypothetical protein